MSITLRTGDIVRADPVKKLYKVVYSISPYLEEYAVPVDGLHTSPGSNGVTSCTSYAIGDHVLYVCPDKSISMDAYVVWIVGRVPKDIVYTDTAKEEEKPSLFHGDLSGITAELYPLLTQQLQDDGFLEGYSAREMSPIDITTGSYNLNGERTNLHVSDYNILLQAGRSSLLLDSLLGVLTQSSNLYNRYTIGESSRTQLYRGHIVHTKKLTSSVDSGLSPIKKASFPYREQFSDLIYGHREDILDGNNKPIVQVTKSLDGYLQLSAIGGLSLKRSAYIDNRELLAEDSLVAGEPLSKPTRDDKYLPIKDSDDWESTGIIDGTDSIMLNVLKMAGEGEWESSDVGTAVEYTDSVTGEKLKSLAVESGIQFNPDGSVVITDAWGSEIRMGNGNIQISSANNLTTVAGRDMLSIVSGITAINSGVGIEMGVSNGDIAVRANKAIRMSCSEFNKHAVNSKEYIEQSLSVKSEKLSLDITAFDSYFRNNLVITSPSIQLSATSSCILNTSNSALSLSGNCITIGAAMFDVHSNVKINKGKYVLQNIATGEHKAGSITIPASGASLIVGGDVITDRSLVSNEGVQTAGWVYANGMAAKQITATGGIYGLKNAPKKQNKLNVNNDATTKGVVKENTLTDIGVLFTTAVIKEIKNVFKRVSRAFKIIAPRYSKSNGTTGVLPTSCSSEAGGLSYIYPGENFWLKDGLVTVTKEGTDIVRGKEFTVSGCNQLKLNKPNAK